MIKGNLFFESNQDLIKGGAPLIGPASVDLTLGKGFKVPIQHHVLRLGDKQEYWEPRNEDHLLESGEFCLCTTEEVVRIPLDKAGFVVGRSSIARVGLQVECAGFIDPGFNGTITLELFNQSPNVIHLIPGIRICQLVLFEVNSISRAYSGKYQGQLGVTESRIEKDKFYE